MFFLIMMLVVLLSGCVEQPNKDAAQDSESAKNACINKCQDALAAGQDLNNGPCLSNEIAKDWVCDVAHSPRQAVDNNPANQCPAYGINATHFVEVTPSCEYMRSV